MSLFVDLKSKFIFYFDSTADTMPSQIKKLIESIKNQGKRISIDFKIYENKKIEHQKGNNECGMYSLFFIVTLLTRKYNNTVLNKSKVIDLFIGGKRIKDEDMNKLRDIYFLK